MKHHPSPARQSFPAIIVNAANPVPMFRQLYDGLAQAIRRRQFPAGAKLPSTRAFAQHLNVSRNTVHLAFEQLIAEGYLEGRPGAGTYVARTLPEQLLQFAERPDPAHSGRAGRARFRSAPRPCSRSTRANPGSAAATRFFGSSRPSRNFHARSGKDSARQELARMVATRCWITDGGTAACRQAIAEHLATARGVRCTADNVIVVAGAQQGIRPGHPRPGGRRPESLDRGSRLSNRIWRAGQRRRHARSRTSRRRGP